MNGSGGFGGIEYEEKRVKRQWQGIMKWTRVM
jgi:hypothetical protein